MKYLHGKFELLASLARELLQLLNLKAAKALGLTIPQSLLLRADQLFQCADVRGSDGE